MISLRQFLPACLPVCPIVLIGLAITLQAQSPTSHPQPRVSATRTSDGWEISGVVLNSKTGQPLPDAEVTVSRTKDRILLAQSTTDAEGRFRFQHLPSDKFSLRATHRGFIAAAFEEHESGSTAVVTGDGLVSTGLQFKLAPKAVLYGTVTEDSGDPVPQATVSIFRQDNRNGTGNIVRAGGTTADDQGNYELANLVPGAYFLCVTGTPWYAVHPQPQPNSSDADRPRSPLDVAYPIAFYPDVADSAYAAPIALNAGDRVPIRVTLHPVPSLRITMQVTSRSPDQQFPMPQLRRDLFGTTDYVQTNISFNTPEQKNKVNPVTTIEISGIAPGQYDLELQTRGGEANRETSVNLAADQALDPASTIPLAEISGKLLPAPGGSLPPGIFLMLRPQQGGENIFSPVEQDGSFQARSARPGTYELALLSNGFLVSMARISATGATITGHLIKIGNDPVTITATLGDTSATVSGFVKQDGKPVSGIFLLLASSNPTAGHIEWSTNQSDSDGSFDFEHVLPGQYTLLAIQEGWALDWARPGVLERYLPGGLKVTVPPHTQTFVLKDPVAVQPK
jgi:protocatechuate 3,4-dioxygenase beta subunit